MLIRSSFSAAIMVLAAAAGSAQVVDDFESYADTPALNAVWFFGTLDTTTPTPGGGSRSMLREGFDTLPASGWLTYRALSPALDLSGEVVTLKARRRPEAVTPLGVAISLVDGTNGSSCVSAYQPLTDTAWHTITLDTTVDCASLDLTNIVEIGVFNVNGSGATGTIAVNYDDIGWFLFRDGFEGGTLASWSHSQP